MLPGTTCAADKQTLHKKKRQVPALSAWHFTSVTSIPQPGPHVPFCWACVWVEPGSTLGWSSWQDWGVPWDTGDEVCAWPALAVVKGKGEYLWINIYVNALNNVIVLARRSFMRPRNATLMWKDGDTQILANFTFMTDLESLLSAVAHENSNHGFAITLQIEMRQFYVNIRTEHSGSSLDVFIHDHGFSKIVHLQRQLVCLFLNWNRISWVELVRNLSL